MNKQTKVREVMTREVHFVEPNAIMTTVRDIFRTEKFHHLPVVKDGQVVGIISKTDYNRLESAFTFFRREQEDNYNNAVMRSLLAKEVMSNQVATINQNDPILLAAAYFRENLFHCLPVVDDDRMLVGILTPFDLLNYAFREPSYLEDN